VTQHRLIRKLIFGAVAIVALLPFGFWNLLRPPASRSPSTATYLIYEFRDSE
jgi:hypothetical protein